MKMVDKIFCIVFLELQVLMFCSYMYIDECEIIDITLIGSMIQGFIILLLISLFNYKGLERIKLRY